MQSPQDRPEGFCLAQGVSHGEVWPKQFSKQFWEWNKHSSRCESTPWYCSVCPHHFPSFQQEYQVCLDTAVGSLSKVRVSQKLVTKACCFHTGMESYSWDCSPTKQTRCCSQTYLSRRPSGWSRSVCPPCHTWKWSNSPCWTPVLGRCST